MSDKILCIWHANCDDGFAAAWCVRNTLGADRVEFYPGVYGQAPPDVTGRNVILVDFSYKRPVIEEMIAKCASLLILDHHKTAAADLAGYPAAGVSWHEWGERLRLEPKSRPVVGVLFDMERSGAGITWDFFNNRAHTGERRPEFIDYIEDRDLWRKALPYGDLFTIALRSYPQDFDLWSNFVGQEARWLIKEGAPIWRYYEKICADIAKEAYVAYLDEAACWIVNAPYFAASEVAGELAVRPSVIATPTVFGASFFQRADGQWQYSLRSRGEFDVSELAKRFGGGGHAQAAGFTTSQPIHRRGASVE